MNFLRLYSRFSPKRIPVQCTIKSTFCSQTSFEPDDYRDKLILTIRNAQNTQNLLREVSVHATSMRKEHFLQAFQTLFWLQKAKKTSFGLTEITKTSQFEQLVISLERVLRTLEAHEVVNLLKIAIYFDVNSDSPLVQCLLQMIRHNVNSLTMNDAIFLSFLMKKLTSSPLVEALQIAMSMLVEMRVQKELDVANIDDLIKTFLFVANEKLSPKALHYVCENFTEIPEHVDSKKIINVYWSLTHQPSVGPVLLPLINSTMKYFRSSWKTMQPADIFALFRRMCKMRSKKRYQFFDSSLVSDLVDYFVNDLRTDFNVDKLQTVTYYTRLACIEQDNLASFIIECMDEKKANVNKMNVSSLTNCLEIVSVSNLEADRISGFLRKYLPAIFTIDYSDSTKKLMWLKLFLIFAHHGIYDRQLIEKLFDESTMRSAVFNSNDYYYAAIYQIAKQLVLSNCPENADALPSEGLVDNISRILDRSMEYNLDVRNYLEMAFGGETYVACNVKNDFGFNIDFLVQMRKDGYPAGFEANNVQHLKDVNVQSGSDLVAVIVMSEHCYLSNRAKLKNAFKLFLDVLEQNNVVAVPIAQKEWANITNREKIPYLMQAINLKLKDKSEQAKRVSL